MAKSTFKTKRTRLLKPKKSAEVPVTKRHLDLVKQELKSGITSGRLETKSLKVEVNSLRLEMKAGFAKVDSRFEKIESVLFEMKALLDE